VLATRETFRTFKIARRHAGIGILLRESVAEVLNNGGVGEEGRDLSGVMGMPGRVIVSA